MRSCLPPTTDTGGSSLHQVNDYFLENIIFLDRHAILLDTPAMRMIFSRKSSQVTKKLTKQELFDDYFHVANEAFMTLENVFALQGVWKQVFGVADEPISFFQRPELEQAAKERVRASSPWQRLEAVYEYAENGIDGGRHPIDIVLGGQEVLTLVRTEEHCPCDEWYEIVARGDGRYSLDDGQYIELTKVALLANVDIRTVRNAVSSGELTSRKTDSVVFVENASARAWLLKRRGFKPTIVTDETFELATVSSATQFGAALSARRKAIGLDDPTCAEFAKSLNRGTQTITELERGVFTLPIDAAFPLADLYRVDRKVMLQCVMRIFFPEQLLMLQDDPQSD